MRETQPFLAGLGRVAVASAYLEDELHRAVVSALGSTKEAEQFAQTLPGPGLIDLFRVTHDGHDDTEELARRCRTLLDLRNRFLHGVTDIGFDETTPPYRMRNRKKKGHYAVPTADELNDLADRLREAAVQVWVQSEGLSVEYQQPAWTELIAG